MRVEGWWQIGFSKGALVNVALLAKWDWRLITCPDSLLLLVYKARYFPTSSFLEASIGNNPSYAWRSVLASQELLRKGARIRIGNGSSTKIWGSAWLADEEAPCISTPLPQGMANTTVDSLKCVNGLSVGHVKFFLDHHVRI